MKNKWMKRTLLVGAVGIVAGGILLGAGVALEGSASFYYDKNGFHVKENTPEEENTAYVLENTLTGKLKEIEVVLEDADLEIVSGDDWAVEYVLDGSDTEPVYEVKDGKLVLEEGGYAYDGEYMVSFGLGGAWWRQGDGQYQSPYVKITIPDGEKLDSVKIRNSYGRILIDRDLLADSVTVDAQDGEVCMEGWSGKELALDLEYASLETGDLDGDTVDITSEDGTVRIGTLKAETVQLRTQYGELTADVDGADRVDVESEDGTVNLNLVGGMDQYGVNLYSEYGSIHTPQGRVEEDEYDGSSDFLHLADDQKEASVIVYTQYGDIRIREK